jgi:tRNA(Ile)-lysidine synthase
MCLAILLILRHYKKNYPLTNIHIIHCNHKIRTQSEAEEAHIQQFFKGTTLHTFHRNTNEKADENSLRKRRYQCFYQVLQKNNISLLLLGHHLEDRIESTLLNCIRGTGLKGFLNMQIHQNHPLLKFPVYRPLLNSTKKQIIAFCEKFHIKYFEDETNSDITTSQRNILRHEIIEKLVNINS